MSLLSQSTNNPTQGNGFHGLHHTFASMSANAGALLAGVLNLAGQSSPAMTIYYYQGTMDTAGAAVRAFTSLLAATAKYAAGA